MDAPEPLVFNHEAMSTWWQIRIADEAPDLAAQAAAEAFRLVDALEQKLSRFRDDSDLARIAATPAGSRVRVSVWTLDCLAEAREWGRLTGGRFCAGFRTSDGDAAWELDPPWVVVHKAPCRLDLGAVGKGFAVDRASELLDEWGVAEHLVSAGGSSLRAGGRRVWPVGVGDVRIALASGSLGASGTSARGGHLVLPNGLAAACGEWERTWAHAPTAAEADALSTAATWWSAGELADFCATRERTGLAALPRGERPIFAGTWPEFLGPDC